MKQVVVVGGSGYLGRPSIGRLLEWASCDGGCATAVAPWKAARFRSVDLVSLEQSLTAAKQGGVEHFVFVSVAQPALVMKAFIEIRIRCEQRIRESGLDATILRPWYVLGPGHYWPYVLVPFYKALEAIPATRDGAVHLGLVRHSPMVNALAAAVASDARGVAGP